METSVTLLSLNRLFKIDWDQVQTIEDIKCILKLLDITFTAEAQHFDLVQHLIVPVTPIAVDPQKLSS